MNHNFASRIIHQQKEIQSNTSNKNESALADLNHTAIKDD